MTSSTPRAGWKGLQLRRLVPAQPDEWAACCIPAQLPAFLHTCKRRKARIRPSRTPSPALPSLPPPWFTPCTADGLCSRPRGKRKAVASRKARDVGNRWAGPKGSHACVASPWGPVARSWAGRGMGAPSPLCLPVRAAQSMTFPWARVQTTGFPGPSPRRRVAGIGQRLLPHRSNAPSTLEATEGFRASTTRSWYPGDRAARGSPVQTSPGHCFQPI